MEQIVPGDLRYPDLAGKRFNKRFTGKPEYIRLPNSTQKVVEAVQEAVDSKRRLVVRKSDMGPAQYISSCPVHPGSGLTAG